MTTLLFTIAISAEYRGTQEIYSAQVVACNGEKLYHLAEAPSISAAPREGGAGNAAAGEKDGIVLMREPEQIRFAASDWTIHCSQLFSASDNACVQAPFDLEMTTLTLPANERSVEIERAFFLTFQIL